MPKICKVANRRSRSGSPTQKKLLTTLVRWQQLVTAPLCRWREGTAYADETRPRLQGKTDRLGMCAEGIPITVITDKAWRLTCSASD